MTAPGMPAPERQDPTTGESITLHEKFYFPDSAGGLSVFKVDGTYYKVHRYMLERESPVFKEMFSAPSPSEGQDGESNEKPIHIPDVSRSEFEALLNFLYDGAFSCFEIFINQKDSIMSTSTNVTGKQKTRLLAEMMENIRHKISNDNTLAIFDLLSISLRFEFERISKVACAVIDLLDHRSSDFGGWQELTWDFQAIKRINMALRHDALRHWQLPALRCLVNRSAPLTADEGRSLGYHRMAFIAAEREKRLIYGMSYQSITSVPSEFLLSG